MFFAWTNFVILIAISAFHVFWALGGKFGSSAVVPEFRTKKVFKPGPFATLVVAFIAAVMAFFHLYKKGLILLDSPAWLSRYGLWLIAAAFLIRAIGDFRYVGFFKKIRTTYFARQDTRFYSPLCVLISMNAVLTNITDI